MTQEFIDIYSRYGDPITSWSKIINKVTVASVNNAFQNIEAFDLFRKREIAVSIIQKEVTENLQKLGFTVTMLNVMNIDIPSKFNSAVKKT